MDMGILRIRFTVRRLMVAVAVVAISFGIAISLTDWRWLGLHDKARSGGHLRILDARGEADAALFGGDPGDH